MALTDSHQRASPGGQRQLRIALALTVAMMVIEFAAGWISGSLSLLADAGHMLTDALALAFSLFAAWIASRPANTKKTYGYYRMEILAALANGVVLWLIVIGIYVSALERLRSPAGVFGELMIVVAVVGLLVNLLSGWVLRSARAGSLNVEAAWLNVMSDALGSLGVIIAGVLIHWFGWRAADPVASMIIGILIAISSCTLIARSVNILLEGAPGHLRAPDVMGAMRTVPGVAAVHDLHLWTITTGMDAMSGHVVIDDIGRSAEMLDRLNGLLSERFGITHATLQLEPPQHVCQMMQG